MNCLFSGAIVCIGGAQKRAGGVASAKYSVYTKLETLSDLVQKFLVKPAKFKSRWNLLLHWNLLFQVSINNICSTSVSAWQPRP